MKSKEKFLLLSLCAVLLIVSSVFGTLAYLTDAEAVTNTFTVGKVGLTLDEAEVNPDGTKASEDRVQSNHYKLLPGRTYIKDPTVTVKEESIESYIRMMVEIVNVAELKAALPDSKYYADLDNDADADDFDLRLLLNDSWNYDKWHFAGYSENGTSGIYEFRYHEIVADKVDDSGQHFDNRLDPLFEEINVPGEIDNDHLANLEKVTVNVTAHAIQAPGFDTAEEAWTAFDVQNQ